MAGTRADIQAMVYDRLGVPTTDPQITAAVVQRFINDALHELEVEHDWPWLQASETLSLVAGTDTYALAAAWRRTIQLRISGDVSLDRYSIGELNDRWSDTVRGRPEEYALFGDQLVVRPTPDAAYSLVHRYLKKETALSGDASTPLLPVEYHPAIAEKVVALCARRLREEARAAGAEAAYQQWLGKMRDDTRRSRTNGRVRVRPGSDW